MNDFAPLLQTGAIGAVLAWLLLKALPAFQALQDEVREGFADIGKQMEIQSRTQLLTALSQNGISAEAKRQMERVLAELDLAKANRDDKARLPRARR